MRLLTLHLSPSPTTSTNPPTLILKEFIGDHIPPYAILSHRWGADDEEISLKDLEISSPTLKTKKGYAKIVNCCLKAVSDGFAYLWCDTCCIDKSSSAELSEGINSMYAWYKESMVCYAYLDDVMSDEDPAVSRSSFRNSAWFTRGWTLQELLAPESVVFIAQDWIEIGTKASLARVVTEITNIDQQALLTQNHVQFSVAKKMSWAARRRTTRVEDRAYSLLGLFGVNMPAIYGEGDKAFQRLQNEILKGSIDHTIFAWNPEENGKVSMLADSPDRFAESNHFKVMDTTEYVRLFDIQEFKPDYAMTNSGLQIHLSLLRIKTRMILKCLGVSTQADSQDLTNWYFAFIACKMDTENKRYPTTVTCIMLEKLEKLEKEGSVYSRRDLDGVATFQISTDAIHHVAYEPQALSITIREGNSATSIEWFAQQSRTIQVHSFLLETSSLGSFQQRDKSSERTWMNIEPKFLSSTHTWVIYRCRETQQQFVATVGILRDRAWCSVKIIPDAHGRHQIIQHDISLLSGPTSDWVSIPRERRPGRIVATVRKRKDVAFLDVTYTLKIMVLE